MTDKQISRRTFLVTGGAASLLILAPEAVRSAAAATTTSSSTPPAASIGFVNTVEPLTLGAWVKPVAKVRGDTSLVNRVLQVSVGDLHPRADATFPPANLDAVFSAAGAEFPFHALTHRGGIAHGRSNFVITPTKAGLRFVLETAGTTANGVLGTGTTNGLRTGTYLFGLSPSTWANGASLADKTAQRSLIVVIRPA